MPLFMSVFANKTCAKCHVISIPWLHHPRNTFNMEAETPSMKRSDIINEIQVQTGQTKKTIKDVLLALSVVLAGELQANEPVEVPHLGRKLDAPIRRARTSQR